MPDLEVKSFKGFFVILLVGIIAGAILAALDRFFGSKVGVVTG